MTFLQNSSCSCVFWPSSGKLVARATDLVDLRAAGRSEGHRTNGLQGAAGLQNVGIRHDLAQRREAVTGRVVCSWASGPLYGVFL